MLEYLLFMKNRYLKQTALITTFVLSAGCDSNIQFAPIELPQQSFENPKQDVQKEEISDVLKPIEEVFEYQQNVFGANHTTISFQIIKQNGQLAKDINKDEMTITENGLEVTKYNLTKNSESFRQVVDIVFAVDVTASMRPTIEAAKSKLINFINQSRKAGYHTRMCLVTFGDYTVKKCDRFYDNNPDDPESLSQVAQLISEITKLKALTGSQDPGGKDKNENPMRALIDASKSPWATNNQRFLILMTDDGFLYSPGNQGSVGKLAPQYSEVKEALKLSNMKVFASTPDLGGYNKNFGQDQGIVNLSQGEWFNYNDLIKGKISLDTILNRIITNVNTTFIAEYTVEDNDGLRSDLPLSQRRANIYLKNPSIGTISPLQMNSNMPDGHEQYKNEFTLSSNLIDPQSVKVFINDVSINQGFSLTDKGVIKFFAPPQAGSRIKIIFHKLLLKDKYKMKPLKLKNLTAISNLEVRVNDYKVDRNLYTIMKSDEGFGYLIIDSELLNNDKYDIEKNNQLHISVKISYNP